jgi:hypothetical protein
MGVPLVKGEVVENQVSHEGAPALGVNELNRQLAAALGLRTADLTGFDLIVRAGALPLVRATHIVRSAEGLSSVTSMLELRPVDQVGTEGAPAVDVVQEVADAA